MHCGAFITQVKGACIDQGIACKSFVEIRDEAVQNIDKNKHRVIKADLYFDRLLIIVKMPNVISRFHTAADNGAEVSNDFELWANGILRSGIRD